MSRYEAVKDEKTREERLAEALRENLRRRKERARSSGNPPPPGGGGTHSVTEGAVSETIASASPTSPSGASRHLPLAGED
ncbi:hypothetical protein [Sphingomonas immobilis]|uniref:Uncharacterized protein n=1 Tax=Sphingomonas immobilis TaxID=3063997 RepID=A0ABT9A2E4_9SPHN|nr:hypothetical protein [Sphingomonas sp. CA1-15]MDO7844004.1 hypothetical protein [Sphingomonas sp. CA1-15]